ncbi:hypothetical protein LWC08_11215 [Desulfobaculum bizertense]|uniref:hypothetical protein n=1 Tax=Desulfobaculum bizertense TaxID=376490 RepID=UPI001F3CF039|nr:hypothetical protein [Desulfobaculum bizertense]UIJ37296.1 hypothetical protein LWC08_11215 [Desulfobaculum bizertense]
MRVLLPFSAALIFFLNARVQKENGGELAEEKEALDVMPNKFEFHSREAWMKFKFDEDT